MSWNFRKAGKDKVALKAAVQAETACPQAIRDELCARVDGMNMDYYPGSALLVHSFGHLEAQDAPRPWNGCGDLKLSVEVVPYIDTPLAA